MGKSRSNLKAAESALRWQIVRAWPDLPGEAKLAWYQIWFELGQGKPAKISIELKFLSRGQGTSPRSAMRYIEGLARTGILKVLSRQNKSPAGCTVELFDPIKLDRKQQPSQFAESMLFPSSEPAATLWGQVRRSALRGVSKLGWSYLWFIVAKETAGILLDVRLSELALDQGVDSRSPKRLIQQLAKYRLLQIKGAAGAVWNIVLNDPEKVNFAPRKQAKRTLGSVLSTGANFGASTPKWDRNAGELVFGGAIVKRITKILQAKHAMHILDTFQLDGWPRRIDDPLPGGADRDRLKDALKGLNRGLTAMRFERDGTGKGIRWNPL
jgi:hypothetical protein